MALPSNNILILILIVSTLTISTCDGGSGYPLAAKASLLRFWRRVLPNVKFPPLLMEAASPLDATSVSVFAGFITNHTITDHIASFCTAANLLCAGDKKSGTGRPGSDFYIYAKVEEDSNSPSMSATRLGEGQDKKSGTGRPGSDFYSYAKVEEDSNSPSMSATRLGEGQDKKSGTGRPGSDFYSYAKVEEDSNSPSMSATRLGEGQVFREKLLVQGSNLFLPNMSDDIPRRSFLPRSLAEKLPRFSSQNLPQLMQMFRISENSGMGFMMANALQECELPAIKGEIKRCVTTVEEMAEFALGILGAKMEGLNTWSTAGSGDRVQVGEVNRKDRGKSVLCHPSMFPYLIYYCHSLTNLRVYEVSLMQKNNEKINEAVAICHMDTTDWRADHAAFMALGHKPGEIEVCHWIYQNGLVWVPLP